MHQQAAAAAGKSAATPSVTRGGSVRWMGDGFPGGKAGNIYEGGGEGTGGTGYTSAAAPGSSSSRSSISISKKRGFEKKRSVRLVYRRACVYWDW